MKNIKENQNIKKGSVADRHGHYDIDGVSLSSEGVIMASQNPIHESRFQHFVNWVKNLVGASSRRA